MFMFNAEGVQNIEFCDVQGLCSRIISVLSTLILDGMHGVFLSNVHDVLTICICVVSTK